MASKPTPVIEGIVFPANEKGDRSTTDAAKNLFAEVFNSIGEGQLAKDVLAERNMRYRYSKFLLKHVEISLKSPESALKQANAGLNFLHNNFEFIRDGKSYKLAEAMKLFKSSFHTGFVKGSKPKPSPPELVVPYKGKQLRGEELIKQLKKWADYGTIEPTTAEAISQVVKNPGWVDLSDQYFVLLGAGSAMGPFLVLMALGANVVAIDLDREGIWKRLITIAEQSPGTLTFPLKKPQKDINSPDELYKNAGSNLITQAPEILSWLQDVYSGKQLTVGCYVYLDGEAHVKVALACDAIMKGLAESRKAGLAYLCTPTDAHVIPEEARKAALANYHSWSLSNLLIWPIRMFTGRKILAKNAQRPVTADDGRSISYVDGIVVPQGPNYAIAKRMQHWRAIVARSSGNFVSSHIAPSTATASVVHNKQFAWAYDGMPFFVPFEIFEQETSNAVMSAILIQDLRNKNSIAQPQTPLKNPLEMFKETAFHGGVWRAGYTVGSIGEVSVLVHFVKVLRPVLFLILVAIVAVLYNVFLNK